MYLSKFLKHYNLSPKQLEQILKQNNLDSNLRRSTKVPQEWNELVRQHTGIAKMEEETVSYKIPKENINTNTDQINDYQKQLEQAKQIISKENKDDYFVACVKFVARDKSHVYIKRIDDINDIRGIDLVRNDYRDYFIGKNIDKLRENQLIICSPLGGNKSKERKVKDARLISDDFKGTFAKMPNGIKFTDWTSLKMPLAINRIFRDSKDNEFSEYGAIKLFYSSTKISTLTCEVQNKDVNVDEIRKAITNRFQICIAKDTFDEFDKITIEVYKWQVEESELEAAAIKLIKSDINDKKCFETPLKTREYIQKWNVLRPNAFSYLMVSEPVNPEVFMNFWMQGLLSFTFWDKFLIEVLLNHFREKPLPNNLSLVYKGILNDDYLPALASAFEGYFEKHTSINNFRDHANLTTIVNYLSEEKRETYKLTIQKLLSPNLKLEYWLSHKETEFPKNIALRLMGSLDEKQQIEVINQLDDKDVLSILVDIKTNADENLTKRLLRIVLNYFIEVLHPICFDLETDRKNIQEIAFGHDLEWQECQRKTELDGTLAKLKSLAGNSNNLFIGQNVIEFDCPILEENDIRIQQNKIWDTMLVEMFLSPEFKSYALKTAHHAIDDAKLTFQLFVNQLLRVLKLDSYQFETIIVYFPTVLAEKIKSFKSLLALNWLPQNILQKERDNFFRPQPRLNSIVKKLKQQLANFSGKTRIILGPEMYAKDLFMVKDIVFYTTDFDDDFALISNEKVEGLADANDWSSVVLKRYLLDCKNNQISPYWGNLAVSIKIRLTKETGLEFILAEREKKPDWTKSKTIFTTVTELKQNKEQISKLKNLELFVLDPDLLSVSHKEMLKEIDMNSMLNNEDINHLWMKFSGGQSIIGLTKQQAIHYIGESQANYSNYWLEKYQYGKYRIFGSYNWEEMINYLPAENRHFINLELDNFKKSQVYFSVVTNKSAKSSEVVRYNPESIYRSRYWVYQKMLVEQIDSNKSPAVLLVQRHEEVFLLEKYFGSLGYFVPNGDATLGRRMELLHKNKTLKKILIAPTNFIGKILHANYLGSLSIILDSFHLAENSYMSRGTSLFKRMETQSAIPEEQNKEELGNTESEGQNEDDEFIAEVAKQNLPMEKDTFFLLKLQLPYINYLRTLIDANDPEHKLWLLDPRITDYPELGETWQATKNSMSIWNDPDSYEKDAKEADVHIPGVRPNNTLPFEMDEIKKILSIVFLGQGNNWYDYQEEYLDEIVPGKKDFLISLPTGGGKSLLFQAPSLFKSSFSNKLTLVITPLKALMEDQVKALWNKGFIGSVEYINADRSSDLQLIYRSLAGGELALLYITPERFRSKGFLNALKMRLQSDGGLEYVVFDEAHCVSQWGHEFRPDYLNSARSVCSHRNKCEESFPILLFSATVSEKVYQDFNLVFHD